ncbi:hypothetical protein U9M48_011616 [Paspalum notatum var. saurae]|uniref:DUF4220 domain-containing protein n=1 Tax=Paspalum notatum var. saurae TaxID=547442 RepID=A0AAQ3SVU7_PASNO
MAWENSTAICYNNAALQKCSSNISCSRGFLAAFYKSMGGKMVRVNMLILADAVLAGVIVVIGAYAQRYRHHPLTRFIFLGATTLFLPIISYVVSTIGTNTNDYIGEDDDLQTLTAATCHGGFHQFTVVSWAFLVQIVVINTSVVVAVGDREGRNKGPPIQLLVQGIWTLYLGVTSMGPLRHNMWPFHLELLLFAIIFAKIVLKFYAYLKARQSLAFKLNPRLIFGYMKQLQLQESSQDGGQSSTWEGAPPAPPPLLVMGEEGMQVEKQPHGYVCKDLSPTALVNTNDSIVTVDKVWQLDSMLAAISRPQLKDVCLSFSLFKLLRCRFARYDLSNAESVRTKKFFWSLLLKDGKHARVFGVIADELSFVRDYYYSSFPVSYAKYWLPFLSVGTSLLSITYCVLATVVIMMGLLKNWKEKYNHQLRCDFWCSQTHLISDKQHKAFGFFLFDDVPLFFLLALVVTAEVRYIASYFCSNWTKVALICHYINHASLQHCLRMRKWFGLLLQCRWEVLMKHWDEKMGQSSLLVVHPKTTPLVLLRRLLGLPNLDRSVKIPEAVQASIIRTLRGYNNSCNNGQGLSNGRRFLSLSQVGQRFLWACRSKSTSDIILTWHIATCILEVRHPYQHGRDLNNHKITATHLSRYCAYLMVWSPDLLPDDDEWSKSLYEVVKKDAECALAGYTTPMGLFTPEAEYKEMIHLLDVYPKHEVLENGVKLGRQLVELVEGEETAWKVLAGFWSEMILYIAPSDNVRGHLEAIARGGELITLLWALLTHAGIVSRPRGGVSDDYAFGGTATSDAAAYLNPRMTIILQQQPSAHLEFILHNRMPDGHLISDRQDKHFGFFLFDDIPLFFLLALVVTAEVRYIAAYICSKWTKVALICHYINNHAPLQRSVCMQRWFGLLLKCRWEMLMKHWDEKMGQGSVLVLHPRTTPLVLLRRLLGLPDLDSSVKIPEAVKASIIHTLRGYYNCCNGHGLSNGRKSLGLMSPVGERLLWACSCKSNGTSDIILT